MPRVSTTRLPCPPQSGHVNLGGWSRWRFIGLRVVVIPIGVIQAKGQQIPIAIRAAARPDFPEGRFEFRRQTPTPRTDQEAQVVVIGHGRLLVRLAALKVCAV